MNKYLSNFVSGLFIILAVSCQKELDRTNKNFNKIEKQIAIEASIGTPNKTLLDENGIVYWSPNDSIFVFFGDNPVLFHSYNYTPTTTAMFYGSVLVVQGSNEFEGPETEETRYWGVYPAVSTNNHVSSRVNDCVYVSVEPLQTSLEGTFDRSSFVMVAESDDYQQLNFKNLCGGIRFKLASENIDMVTFCGNNNEVLCGECEVAMNSDGLPFPRRMNAEFKKIRLTAPGNSCFKPGVWYYIISLPTKLDEGFTMKFISKSSHKMATLRQGGKFNIGRSVFGSLNNPDSGLTFSEYDNSEEEPLISYSIGLKSISYDGTELKLEPEYSNDTAELLAEKVGLVITAEIEEYARRGNYIPFRLQCNYNYNDIAGLSQREYLIFREMYDHFYNDYLSPYYYVFRTSDASWYHIDYAIHNYFNISQYDELGGMDRDRYIGSSSDGNLLYYYCSNAVSKYIEYTFDIKVLGVNSENKLVCDDFSKSHELIVNCTGDNYAECKWWIDSSGRPAGIITYDYDGVDGSHCHHIVDFDENGVMNVKSTARFEDRIKLHGDLWFSDQEQNIFFFVGNELLSKNVQFSVISLENKSITDLKIDGYFVNENHHGFDGNECQCLGNTMFVHAWYYIENLKQTAMIHAWWDNGIKYEIFPDPELDATQKYGDTTYGLWWSSTYIYGGYVKNSPSGYSFVSVPGLYYEYGGERDGYTTVNYFGIYGGGKRVYSFNRNTFELSYYDFIENRFTRIQPTSIPDLYEDYKTNGANRDGLPFFVVSAMLVSDQSYVKIWINADTGAVEVIPD